MECLKLCKYTQKLQTTKKSSFLPTLQLVTCLVLSCLVFCCICSEGCRTMNLHSTFNSVIFWAFRDSLAFSLWPCSVTLSLV